MFTNDNAAMVLLDAIVNEATHPSSQKKMSQLEKLAWEARTGHPIEEPRQQTAAEALLHSMRVQSAMERLEEIEARYTPQGLGFGNYEWYRI